MRLPWAATGIMMLLTASCVEHMMCRSTPHSAWLSIFFLLFRYQELVIHQVVQTCDGCSARSQQVHIAQLLASLAYAWNYSTERISRRKPIAEKDLRASALAPQQSQLLHSAAARTPHTRPSFTSSQEDRIRIAESALLPSITLPGGVRLGANVALNESLVTAC